MMSWFGSFDRRAGVAEVLDVVPDEAGDGGFIGRPLRNGLLVRLKGDSLLVTSPHRVVRPEF